MIEMEEWRFRECGLGCLAGWLDTQAERIRLHACLLSLSMIH